MHPHLTMIRADERVAEMHRSAERSPSDRDVPGRPKRRFLFRLPHAWRVPRSHVDLRAAR
jgi:hypothetical protein